MTAEIFIGQGLASLELLARGLDYARVDTSTIAHFINHEGAHKKEDEIGYGEFGFQVVWDGSGWGSIMAYYRPLGTERTPQQMVKIAQAPGFSEMSDQDLFIFNMYRTIAFQEEEKERLELKKDLIQNEKLHQEKLNEDIERMNLPWLIKKPVGWNEEKDNDFTDRITGLFREKIRLLIACGDLANSDQLNSSDSYDLLSLYSQTLRRVLDDTLSELEIEYINGEDSKNVTPDENFNPCQESQTETIVVFDQSLV